MANDLVSIFKTGDPALLPLATMALDAEGIDYSVRSVGKSDSLKWMMSAATKFSNAMEIIVAADVADRARDLLAGLVAQDSSPMPSFDAGAAALTEAAIPPGIELEDASTGASVGTVTEEQWQELTSHLAEQGPNEYVIDEDAIHALEEADADRAMIDLLRPIIGGRVRWRNL